MQNQQKDLVGAGLTATIGAGIITSYAVSQGQHPLVATGITLFSAILSVIIYKADLI